MVAARSSWRDDGRSWCRRPTSIGQIRLFTGGSFPIGYAHLRRLPTLDCPDERLLGASHGGPARKLAFTTKGVRGLAAPLPTGQAHRPPLFLILRTMVSTIAASTVVLNLRANR